MPEQVDIVNALYTDTATDDAIAFVLKSAFHRTGALPSGRGGSSLNGAKAAHYHSVLTELWHTDPHQGIRQPSTSVAVAT